VWLASLESDFLKGRLIWSNWDVEELRDREKDILEGDLLTVRLRGWDD